MQMDTIFPPPEGASRVHAVLTLPGQLVALQIPCYSVPSYTKKDGKVSHARVVLFLYTCDLTIQRWIVIVKGCTEIIQARLC